MAQLAVSAVGAAVGFAVGGPAGAQWGWLAGSLIGGLAFAPNQQGPRIQDTRVQVSSYGVSLPIAYGGVRLAGNVIWATDLQENSSESSGKGGPTVTTYSYSVSCAVAICEGPIGGIRRIWADAKLVYDAREDADAATQAASTAFAEYMTVYLGSEDQMPDPTIEAAEGAGDVEAYRGVAYVVFTDLPLGDYGNRVPNFTFETTTEASEAVEQTLLEPLRVYDWSLTGGRPVHSVGDTLYTSPYVPFSTGTDYQAMAEQNAANHSGGGYFGSSVSSDSSEWIGAYRTSQTTTTFNFDGVDVLGSDPEYVWYSLGVSPDGQWDADGRSVSFGVFDESLSLVKEVRYLQLYSGEWPVVTRRTQGLNYLGTPETVYPFYGNSASGITLPDTCTFFDCILSVAWFYPLLDMSAKRVPTHSAKSCYAGNPCSAAEGAAELPGNSDFCLTCEGEVTPNYDWTVVSGTAKVLCDVEYRDNCLYQNALGPVLLPGDPNYSNSAYWTAARDAAVAAGTMQADVSYPVVVSSYASGEAPETMTIAAGSMLLSDIVTDICTRAGLQESEIDVSQLVDEVQGYIVSRQMPARNAIQPLTQAFFFDAVENGEQIVFVKRGGASAVTISADDLGANEDAQASALVVPKRAQETELPAEVNVSYMVRDADYQTGTQQARRVTTGSQQIATVELPIVMNDEYGAKVADVLMTDAWQGRVERDFVTTRKFTKYLPTDVVTLNDSEFTYRGRITSKNEDGPLIRWKLRDEQPASYDPNVTPSPTSGGGSSILFIGPMAVALMDLPALRDEDDNAGFYAGAYSYIGTFRGGILYRSVDDTSFTALQEMRVPATLGHATTVLNEFDGGNIFDEVNTVTVTLHSGSLSSVTRAEILGGANGAMLGSEVLQFRTATLLSSDTYRLSGLLRGRRGTEWAMTGHTASDTFVLLNPANVYRISQSLSQLGAAYYRPVAYGQSIALAGSQEFSNTGIALKPFAPVHLYATAGGGDIEVTWKRRTRIGGAWADNIDVPLSEAIESYRVRLLDILGDVIEEQTVSTQYATLTDTSEAYSVEVCQLSASVGAGYPATLIL